MPPMLTQKQFIEKARAKHGNIYDYSKVDYKGHRKEIIIICNTHGPFLQRAANHLRGYGCRDCSYSHKWTLDEFVTKAQSVHGNEYDYSKVKYDGMNECVIIICNLHGEFSQLASSHLRGHGCSVCFGNRKKTIQEFITEASIKHGNRYNYSKVNYDGNKTDVIIICNEHGEFLQRASAHLQGQGCPGCASSRTETLVREIIERLYPIKFPKARPKFLGGLELDCYNKTYNLAIEYNGLQHYEHVPYFHRTEDDFKKQQERDKRKAELCSKHGVDLYIIPYQYDYRDSDRLENYIRGLLQGVLIIYNNSNKI
jgi:hypothetical protein